MICLCLSGGIIYFLPHLREVYYIPLQEALQISNTQMGFLMSIFGITSLISYFPGGWLADRISTRILLSISLWSTGIAGMFFASFPSFKLCIVLHAFWGISVTLTFWAALIKATRKWALADQQGRAFGILESGRGITEVIASTILLGVFARLGSGDLGLSWVIIIFSGLNILIGLMAWFVLGDQTKNISREGDEMDKIKFKEILGILKMPVIWLISLVILGAYAAYWGSYYFTPYATDVFMMSVVFGGALGVGKMWLKPFSALGAGFVADKIGPSRAVIWSFGILIFSFSIFVMIPGKPELVLILIVNSAVASLAIFALRGIYFALLQEGGVPLALTGTATGIISVIGYTPDIFMPLVGGLFLDGYPGIRGYRYFFLFIALLSLAGLLAATIILKKYVKMEGHKHGKIY
jgi:sugar phosphate permease